MMFRSRCVQVPWISVGILLVAVLGIILFLYGSNAYNAISGWAGVFLIVGAIAVYLAREVHGALRKRGR
jgi:hypothetical protein